MWESRTAGSPFWGGLTGVPAVPLPNSRTGGLLVMHIFAQKQRSGHQTKPTGSTAHSRVLFSQNFGVRRNTRRTIGNVGNKRAQGETVESRNESTRFDQDFCRIPTHFNDRYEQEARSFTGQAQSTPKQGKSDALSHLNASRDATARAKLYNIVLRSESEETTASPEGRAPAELYRTRSMRPLARKAGCSCGGSCPKCQSERKANEWLSPGLRISKVGDSLERDADQMAERIMRAPATVSERQTNRKGLPHRQLSNMRQHGSASEAGVAPPIVRAVMSSSGAPLNLSTRAFMEPRFGYDFGDVRVHTDAHAAESARAVQAEGYTVGRDIVFDKGKYEPHTRSGKTLLAHELTHVVQQRAIGTQSVQRQTDGQQRSRALAYGLSPQALEEGIAAAQDPDPAKIIYSIPECKYFGCPLTTECDGRPCALHSCDDDPCGHCPDIFNTANCFYSCVGGGSAVIWITILGKWGPWCVGGPKK